MLQYYIVKNCLFIGKEETVKAFYMNMEMVIL